MLYHYRAHRVVRHQTSQTTTVSIQAGTNLFHHFVGSAALLCCPLDDPTHLPVQVFLLVRRRNTRVYHATPVILRWHHHVVASVGQLLDLKLGRQFASVVHTRGGGLVEAVKATPRGQADAATNNIHNQLE